MASSICHIVLYSTYPAFKDYYDKQENGQEIIQIHLDVLYTINLKTFLNLFFGFRFEELPMQLEMLMALGMTTVLFHVLDRQMEFTSRADFLWKAKLKFEQEEVETMRGINKILLENILPAHVAEHFLSSSRVTMVGSSIYF